MCLLKWQRHVLEMAAFLGRSVNLRKATVSFMVSVCLSVCPSVFLAAWRNLAPAGQIFVS